VSRVARRNLVLKDEAKAEHERGERQRWASDSGNVALRPVQSYSLGGTRSNY